MFEQDYIMRLIKEMVRTLLKLLFHIDMDSQTEELLKEREEKETLNALLELTDEGKINEAENRLYDLISEGDMSALETALLFYSYLNDKTDEFLEENNFSRAEIISGLRNVVSMYGLSGMADVFLAEL